MDVPFIACVDGQQLTPRRGRVRGQRLSAALLPYAQWPNAPQELHIAGAALWLFRTPVHDCNGLEVQLRQSHGAQVALDQLPSLVATGLTVGSLIEPGYFYDVLCVMYRPDNTGVLLTGLRYFCQGRCLETPFMITLDEAKLLALSALGCSPGRSPTISARLELRIAISGMAADYSFLAAFVLSQSAQGDETLGVTRTGKPHFYHERTPAQLRALLGIF